MSELFRIEPGESETHLRDRIVDACDRMEKIYEIDCYSKITVVRQ